MPACHHSLTQTARKILRHIHLFAKRSCELGFRSHSRMLLGGQFALADASAWRYNSSPFFTAMQGCSRHTGFLPCTIWATHGPQWASNRAMQKLPPKAHLISWKNSACFIFLLCCSCPRLLTCVLTWPACRWQVDSAMAWLRSFTQNVRHLADAEHGKAALVVVHEDSSFGEN